MARNYIITSGFCSLGSCPYPWTKETKRHELMKSPQFHELWEDTLIKYTSPKEVLIVDSDERARIDGKFSSVPMVKNFGHQIGEIDGQFCGWTRSWLLGMFYAWINDCDHIFVEQDVLAFGSWISAIYKEADKKNFDMMFGNKIYGGALYEQEIGLTFTRKEFIPEFLRLFMSYTVTDTEYGAEHKIATARKFFGKRTGFHPFGYGLQKPRDFGKTLPFYGHRWGFQDVYNLVILGLVDEKYVSVSSEEGGEEK